MDADEVVRLRVGEQYDVALIGHGATGYQWMPTTSSPHVEIAASADGQPDEEWHPGDRVHDRFVIVALSPGSATVVFERARPWQRDKVVDQQVYEIVVDQA